MTTITPKTDLETDLIAIVAELSIENRKLRLIADAQKELNKARSRIEDIKCEVLRTAYDMSHRSTEPCMTFSQGGVQSNNALNRNANVGFGFYGANFIRKYNKCIPSYEIVMIGKL